MRRPEDNPPIRPAHLIGSSLEDLREMPAQVRRAFGYAIGRAQRGEKARAAGPLRGFHGAGVLEVVDDCDGDTYRAVYTVRFAEIVYVLHVFQKKSRRGTRTPAQEMEIVRARLRRAEYHYRSEFRPTRSD